MLFFKKLYRKVVPYSTRQKLLTKVNLAWMRLWSTIMLFRKQTIANVREIKSAGNINKSIIKILYIIHFVKKKRHLFSCDLEHTNLLRMYKTRNVEISEDAGEDMTSIKTDGKNIYFRTGSILVKNYVDYFNQISYEQSYYNPHRYFSNDRYFIGVENDEHEAKAGTGGSFGVKKGDIVLDLGAAEGTFTLSIADIAKKVYIVECDETWCEALRETFKPYESKVEIVNKFVSCTNTATTITVDTLLSQHKGESVFIKMDLEGSEEAALEGAINTLKGTSNIRVALCTYHRSQDAKLFSDLLSRHGFNICFTDGWIAYPFASSELRKVILRAHK